MTHVLATKIARTVQRVMPLRDFNRTHIIGLLREFAQGLANAGVPFERPSETEIIVLLKAPVFDFLWRVHIAYAADAGRIRFGVQAGDEKLFFPSSHDIEVSYLWHDPVNNRLFVYEPPVGAEPGTENYLRSVGADVEDITDTAAVDVLMQRFAAALDCKQSSVVVEAVRQFTAEHAVLIAQHRMSVLIKQDDLGAYLEIEHHQLPLELYGQLPSAFYGSWYRGVRLHGVDKDYWNNTLGAV